MNHVVYDEESKCNTWYFDIDLAMYDRAIVVRAHANAETGGVDEWGAQTENITLSKDFNTITLSETVAWKGDGKKAEFATSLVTYAA